MTSNEFCLIDKIAGFDGVFTETQVGNCQSATLLAVVFEVTLCIQICVVTDNFDAVFVCTDGTVAAQAVEFATGCSVRSNVDQFVNGQRSVSHVVVDTNCEVVCRFFCIQIAVYGKNHGRSEFLAAQTVTAANDNVSFASEFCKCSNNVQVKGFAQASGFFRSIQNGNLFHCFGQCCNKVCCRERTVKVYFQHAHFFSASGEVIHCFFNCISAATHQNDNLVGIFCSDVIEQVVVSTCQFANFLHVLFNDFGRCKVVLVCCFSVLEVDICILSRTLKLRMFRVQSASAEFFHILHIQQFCHVFVGNFVNF